MSKVIFLEVDAIMETLLPYAYFKHAASEHSSFSSGKGFSDSAAWRCLISWFNVNCLQWKWKYK
jgi:hypothetical protein